jgi:hypothetical protein
MRSGVFLAMALLSAGAFVGCHKEEQAVAGVAQKAEKAEQKAQATATLLDSQRAALSEIPLPTKAMYVDVHDPSQWKNPFLTVRARSLDLRIVLPDTELGNFGDGTMLRPPGARRQELQLRLGDLANAVVAVPAGAWHYGRVIAVAESPEAAPKDKPMVRRNLETVIRELNDLGIVVEEWPSH